MKKIMNMDFIHFIGLFLNIILKQFNYYWNMPINIKLFWNRNEKDFLGYYPLLLAIYKNNIEVVKLLLEYANQHQIILNLN